MSAQPPVLLHQVQGNLRGRLKLTGGVFNAIIAIIRVQRVVGLVPFHTPVVGDFIPLVSSQFLGHLVRHLYVFIGLVPIKNSFKLMVVICNSSVQMVG
ncbi:hypothetical protein [Intestinimonas butyriciproducens]|uniref:hypothetical protein n=1 Tax=Intestinimonas butyriciproducens TaxID=1297617 RepID=UPI003D31F854